MTNRTQFDNFVGSAEEATEYLQSFDKGVIIQVSHDTNSTSHEVTMIIEYIPNKDNRKGQILHS